MKIEKLPSGWAIKKMPQVIKWSSGGTPKATESLYYNGGTIPWLVIGDLNDGIVTSSVSKITELGLQNSNAKLLPSGTLLVAMYGSIGKLGITGIPCCTNQAIAFAKEMYGVTAKYMFYYMALLKPELISKGKGGTQKNISLTVLNTLDVIVPPPSEQERIVDRIEEMLSQIEVGYEGLLKTKKQLQLYRETVLQNAFEGKLTNLASYSMTRLGNYIETPRYGTSKKCNYEQGSNKTVVYRIPNINHATGKICHNDIKYAQFAEKEIAGIRLKKDDILMIRSNGSVSLVGRAAMVEATDAAGTFAGYLMRLRIKDHKTLLPKFFLLYLRSHQARLYIENKAKSTSGVHNINSNEVANMPLPVFDVETQLSIIEAIESRISVCDSIEQTIDVALQQTEAMRQSILKKAFEGTL